MCCIEVYFLYDIFSIIYYLKFRFPNGEIFCVLISMRYVLMMFLFTAGRCASFSNDVQSIGDSYIRNCTYSNPACPQHYNSTDSYMCKSFCLNLCIVWNFQKKKKKKNFVFCLVHKVNDINMLNIIIHYQLL